MSCSAPVRCPAASDGRCHGEALLESGRAKVAIPRDQRRGVCPQRDRAGEVDSVVAAQAKLGSQLAGMLRERFADPHDRQLAPDVPELGDRALVPRRCESPTPVGRRKGSATLRVEQEARGDLLVCIPQLGRQIRARLDHDELHQR